jgi:hypothetical protein
MDENTLSVRVNPNYTISILDSNKKELIFRDIKGDDLEFLEDILNSVGEPKREDGAIFADIEQVIDILNLLNVQNIDFFLFPKRIISDVFEHVKDHILINYVPKSEWLKICYCIQKGSFVNVLDMEKVPMSKFVVMYKIHQELQESVEPDLE